ncbi:MAG: M50 family metallopeptidase [Candidatus Poribacteria bacterium]|nr:M50 family metallopeptidase [Candidatus Poribacteria bacterium]MDE0322332.1 M50 family metallopeptidase [Candidatus Poribacteria bacterium]
MLSIFKRYIALLLIFIAIGFLWNTLFVYPLKIFVVFMHEVSHGLAAIATGGRILEIQINPQQGGHALTQGGSRFWTLTAGYLGSLLWGGVILLLAARTRFDKAISILIGFGMVAISIGFGESTFTYLFGIGFGVALIAIGFYLPEAVNDWVLRIIGVTSCLYAILDIKSDVLDRSNLRSDARMLSEVTGIATEVWGALWILIAIALTIWFLYLSGKTSTAQQTSTEENTEEGSNL